MRIHPKCRLFPENALLDASSAHNMQMKWTLLPLDTPNGHAHTSSSSPQQKRRTRRRSTSTSTSMATNEPTWRWSLSPHSPREWMQRVLLLLLVFVCLLGDFFLWQQVAFSSWSLLRHLVDSGTHFSVGFCCWGIFLCFSHDNRIPCSATDEKTRRSSSGENTTPLPILDEFAPTSSCASSSSSSFSSSSLLIPGFRAWRSFLLSCLLAGVTAAILDIDHFIAAGALSIAGATHLQSRPFGHAVTFIVAVAAVVWVISTKIQRVSKWRRIHRISFVLTALFSHQFRDGMRLGLWFWPIGSTPGIFYPVYIFLECVLPIGLAWWQTTEGRDDGDDETRTRRSSPTTGAELFGPHSTRRGDDDDDLDGRIDVVTQREEHRTPAPPPQLF